MLFFEPLQGRSSKYTKTQFDMGLKEDFTKDLMDLIEIHILNGYVRGTICDALCAELGFTCANARTIYTKTESKIYKKGADRKKTMLAKNIVRLEHLYNVSVKNGKIQDAIKAIDILNKMCDLYTNNIEVQTTNFLFKLGENTDQPVLPETIEVPCEIINNGDNEIMNE